MRARLICFLILIALISCAFSCVAFAQMFGLGAILDPEGSRLFPQPLILPRHAGKPDIRWRNFSWQFSDVKVDSIQYRLYFYPEEDWVAQFAAPQINDQVMDLRRKFNYSPSVRFNYLLFNSQRDFQQANIFDISEGVEGITSTTEATMAIPYWGEAETFRHISNHELVHQFQVQKMNSMSERESERVYEVIPLWFVEGMAEYYSLHGMDAESRVYIRDLLAYPDKKRSYTIPKLFEDGPLNFIFVYKVGQAKLDFFETRIGEGTIQKIMEGCAKHLGRDAGTFPEVVSKVSGISAEKLESMWRDYLDQNYGIESKRLNQGPEDFEKIQSAGENLDSFAVSPDGEKILIREIDPLSGLTSVTLIDLVDHERRVEVARVFERGILSLFFMQSPVLAISDHRIAYVAVTVNGPAIEEMEIKRDKSGHLEIGKPYRIDLYQYGFTQGSSLTFSPDESRLAFVGLDSEGWQNIYVTNAGRDSKGPAIARLTHEYYSWRNLRWTRSGILGASDRTPGRQYNIFLIDPETAKIKQISKSLYNQYAPDGDPGQFVYESWEEGTAQVHLFLNGHDIQETQYKTELRTPVYRNGTLFVLGFNSGRFHLYKVPAKDILTYEITPSETGNQPYWVPRLELLPDIQGYKPFISSGTRIDYLSGFVGTGAILGVSGALSDLMRDYHIVGDIYAFNQIKFSQYDIMFSKQKGRTKWTVGAYSILQARLDNVFSADNVVRTYLYRETGALGALTYPFSAFSFVDLELRVAGANRSDFSDPNLAPQWNAINPGAEFTLVPMVRFGWDHIVYEAFSGPLKGYSLLLESDTEYYPRTGETTERLRVDGSYYWELVARWVLGLEVLGGASFGDIFNNSFFVSSDDIMRGYLFDDPRLYGNYVLAADLEFRFPIGSLFGFEPLRGLLATDYGTIFRNATFLSQDLASSYTAGLTLNFPPLSINFMKSVPVRVAPGPKDNVFHFTLRYLYL